MLTRAQTAAFFLLLVPLVAAAAEPATIVVMNFQSGKGLDHETVKLLNGLMLNEFQKAGGFKVFGEQDLASMLDLEKTRIQTTGCADDACLAEIGGALGAQYLVSPNVGTVGDKFVLNMKMIDVKRAEAVARSSQVVDAQEAALIAATRAAVKEILGGQRASEAPPTPAIETAAEPAAPRRSVMWDVGAWGTAGLVVAAVAGATASAVLASKSFDDLEGTPQINPSKRANLGDEMDTRALAADVLFGVAGAAAVTSVLLFILMPRDSDTQVGFAPSRDGGFLTVGGSLPDWGVRR